MRLTCPNCGAEYDVPGDAIPSAGRDVQCSNCEEVWYQTGPGMMTPGFAAAAAAVSVPAPKRELDPAVRDILREEASREAEARAEEQASRAFSGTPAEPAAPPASQTPANQTPASATPATSSDTRAPVEPQGTAPATPAPRPTAEQAPAEPAGAPDAGTDTAPETPAEKAKPVPPAKPAVSEESARRLREAAARAAALPKRPQEATPPPAQPASATPPETAEEPRPATTATGASAKAPGPMTGNALVRRPEPEPVEADSLPVAFRDRPAPGRTPNRLGFAVPVVLVLGFLFVYGQADRIVISIPASEEAMGQFVTTVDTLRDRVTSEGSRFVNWLTARES